MRRFFQRAYHFLERIKNESRNFLKNVKHFGFRTAKAIFIDGLFPPGKSEKYIAEIENQRKFQYGYVGGKEKKVCQNW